MTIIRCIDCAYDNARMANAGFEIVGIEDYCWADGHTETGTLWGTDATVRRRALSSGIQTINP
jgi:hypothetical protein